MRSHGIGPDQQDTEKRIPSLFVRQAFLFYQPKVYLHSNSLYHKTVYVFYRWIRIVRKECLKVKKDKKNKIVRENFAN